MIEFKEMTLFFIVFFLPNPRWGEVLVGSDQEEPITGMVQKSSGTKMHGMATHEARRAHEH